MNTNGTYPFKKYKYFFQRTKWLVCNLHTQNTVLVA